MKASAHVDGQLRVTESTVLSTLEQEARKAVTDATKALEAAVAAEAPVGKAADGDIHPGLLAKSHRRSVTRTGYGTRGTLRRLPDAWYGRIVTRGRKAGRGRTGRPVGAMAANPYDERAAEKVASVAEDLLEQGATRAARRIETRLGGR